MKRKTRNTFGNPFLAWTELAWKLGEMSMASAQVIAHRTTRMAAAGPIPDARDRQEFMLMGQEKMDAAAESAHTMAKHLTAMHMKLGVHALRQVVNATEAWMSLAGSRSVAEGIARQAKLAQTLSRSAQATSLLADTAARLADHSLEPYHARATANARRLARR